MDLLVIGAGYVGLVTGACFSEMGHHVTLLDIDENKIKMLQQGKIPIYESGLEDIVIRNLEAGRLHFTTSYEEGVQKGSLCFVCVDTPVDQEGTPNLQYIESAVTSLAQHMKDYKIIITKSTVPVGTSNKIYMLINKVHEDRNVTIDFDIVSNPEFLKEGDAVNDFMKPERVIIGSDNPEVVRTMKTLYSSFMFSRDRFITMDPTSAELTKYAANAMLATRISFMNEMAQLCEATGGNIHHIRRGIGMDSRIGSQFLYAGPGFGGSCLPKDMRAIMHTAEDVGLNCPLIHAVVAVNNKQKKLLGEKVIQYFAEYGNGEKKTVGILGLSFKPNTDDMRQAPSLAIIDTLLNAGISVRLYDPIAMDNAKKLIDNNNAVTWCSNEVEVATGAHAIVLVTEWRQFRFLPLEEMLAVMNGKGFFDGRCQYSSQEMANKGFDYITIGQAPIIKSKQKV